MTQREAGMRGQSDPPTTWDASAAGPWGGRRRTAARWGGSFGLAGLALVPLAVWGAAAPGGSIEGALDREMAGSGVPGVAYAVVVDGEVQQVGARGVVALGERAGVTPDTPFSAGSIAKGFTALAVLQLAEAKKLELDAPVSEYLEGYAGRPSGAVTLRQLLSHTSGFSTLQGNASGEDVPSGEDELARIVGRSAGVVPVSPPGTTWAYSNLNYQLLGRVIEVVSGQNYETYVESNILDPVGMTRSFVADGEVHEEMATGHLPWFGTKRPIAGHETSRWYGPQGGVVASARDLALYMGVMLNGEDDILSASGKAAMLQPASEAAPFYGLGWFVDTEAGTVWHSGTSPGVETLATMVPAKRMGVVVLANAGSGVGFRETGPLLEAVTAAALGREEAAADSRWGQKTMFVALVVAPFLYLLSMVCAWRKRDGLRAKSGPSGLVSLWLPLLTTLGAAAFIFGGLPQLFGVPLGTLWRFQPDLALVLTATAVGGVAWAVFRLGVAYWRPSATDA